MAAAPAASFAQALPSDPEADSPSGVVYELPVDRARQDAAPRGGSPAGKGETGDGGGGGGTSSGAAPESSGAVSGTTAGSIRSENNFGTSSKVPGAPSKRRGSGDRSRGNETSGAVPPSLEDFASVAPTSSATTDGPSDGVVFPLLAALLALGAGIGVVAGRRSLRNRRGD